MRQNVETSKNRSVEIRTLAAWALLMEALLVSSQARAQCSKWVAGPLDNGTAVNGTNQPVLTLTSWTPAGAAAPMLVAGGFFTSIEGASANKIAARDGTTGEWQALGRGFSFADVYASTVYNGELFAGVIYNEAGVYRWDGSAWQNVGNIEGTDAPFVAGHVYSMAVYNGELIVAGRFAIAGGTLADSIARWNGTAWRALGSGLVKGGSTLASVYALVVRNGELIVGGDFDTAGGVACARIARWNGTTWSAFTTGGMNGTVRALGLRNGFLYAGGDFTTAGGIACNRIARWFDGPPNPGWFALGSGMDAGVSAMTEYNGDLIAGGGFTTAGGASASRIARWNGSTWIAMGSGVTGGSPAVNNLLAYSGQLIVGGTFTTAGGYPANYLAQWDGRWLNFGGGSVGGVDSMATLGPRLVAGGDFRQSTSVAQGAYNIVGWDGVNLTPLGTGMNGEVIALKSYNLPAPSQDRELVAGGSFTNAGGVSANRIARWVENPSNNPPAQWQPMGAGFNNSVFAIERVASTYVAGGLFTLSGATGISGVAIWNDSTSAWTQLQNGMNGPVWALRYYTQVDPPPFPVTHQYLVAGGDFTTSGGSPGNFIAICEQDLFNGSFTSWSAMGQGFNGQVRAIERFNGSTYVGGWFSASGSTTVNGIARWTGSSWVNAGNFSGIIFSLKASGNYLYAAGMFTAVNGTPTNNIARYNGSNWEAVPGGPDIPAASVMSLAAFNNEIHFGGPFENVGAPPFASRGWTRFLQTGAPWVAEQPQTQSVPCRGNASFAMQPASGFTGLAYSWRKNTVPLSNGPTGYGSTVSGADTTNLVVTQVRNRDAADYDCVLSNACGSSTSLHTTLYVAGCPPTGDLNGDGVLNISDIAPFALSLIDLAAYQQQYPEGDSFNGDMNGDLSLNGRDIGPFIACLISGVCQ